MRLTCIRGRSKPNDECPCTKKGKIQVLKDTNPVKTEAESRVVLPHYVGFLRPIITICFVIRIKCALYLEVIHLTKTYTVLTRV